ncbi:MAG TPA: cytochrome C oxidase subunit IV family protein [Acidimicrobiia bacterium]
MAGDSHAHPTSKQYVQIAILLAIITAVEVALFYVNEAVDMQGWDAPLLVVLSFLKFVIVIGWYMHLRFEKSTLTKFFTAGFVLALLLYAAVLGTFGVLALTG